MKRIVICGLLLLAGCSAQPLPISNVEQDWYEFGQQRAENGWLKQSAQTLAKRDLEGLMTPKLYLAYESGYAQGQQTYCAQSAYVLGVTGKPYNGICDRLDPFFYQDYVSGRHSTAGTMF